jgi:hypothetical protein
VAPGGANSLVRCKPDAHYGWVRYGNGNHTRSNASLRIAPSFLFENVDGSLCGLDSIYHLEGNNHFCFVFRF